MNIHERVFFPSHFKNVLNKHWLSWVFFFNISQNLKKFFFLTVFARTHVFIFLGNVPESGIAESGGNSRFNSLKNCQTAFQTVFTFPGSKVSDAEQVPRLL